MDQRLRTHKTLDELRRDQKKLFLDLRNTLRRAKRVRNKLVKVNAEIKLLTGSDEHESGNS